MNIFLLIISSWFVYYISRSRTNPHFYDIVLGAVAISLLVGLLPTLTQNFVKELFDKRPKKLSLLCLKLSAVFCCLTASAAIFFYVSNAPKDIKQEIPVAYLVNLNTMELPFGLRFNDTFTFFCYDDARRIFKKFKEKNPETAQKIKQMLQANGVDTSGFDIICFQNLTEYLIPYYIGHFFTTDEFESPRYREEREARKFAAYPHNSIRGEIKPLGYIKGELKDNLFFGIEPLHRIELRLPKNTEIALIRDGSRSSTFIIKNKFLEIRIVVHYLLISGNPALLPDSAFSASVPKEQKGPFKEYDTIIYYKATFNKYRYGFPEMQYYEEWANDLLSMLQRKLSWGSPPCVDLTKF